MTEQKALWGWFPAGNVWVKLQVNAVGKLVIDPTALFEEPPTNGEMEKAATSNWSFDHNADPDAHHAAFTAADHLAIGDAAPHHPQAHTLASHTTKAHAELTGVGADDHHARQHVISAAADHSGRIALTQMTDGALNYVLTGQGAGSDPVYAALSPGPGPITILPWRYFSIGAGTWAFFVDAGAMGGGYYYNSTGNNGDNLSYIEYLTAGTYTLGFLVTTYLSNPIADFDINGIEVASWDLYSAGAVYNVLKTQTGIVVAASGPQALKVRAHGKNPLSTNYFLRFQCIAFWRTA